MSRLRSVFIVSLVILAAIFISTMLFIPSGKNLEESNRVQIIEGDEEWILQCDITNNQGRAIDYAFSVTVDDVVHQDSTTVEQGQTYTFIHHIYPGQLVAGEVTFTLREKGKAEPIEQVAYNIEFN